MDPMSDADMIVSMQMKMNFKHTFKFLLFDKWGMPEATVAQYIGILAIIVAISALTEILHQW